MIISNPETLKRAKSARPDDRSCYVNFDAIENLPDEFEAVITEIHYDPANLKASFSDVGGGSWMPRPELMYEIAEACGISGVGDSINEPLIEEVDFSRMSADPLAPPHMVRMAVGRIVKKISEVMQEDGTMRRSSMCTSAYNAYERCCELWSKEESFTDGYTKKGQYSNKYETRWQRRAHFDAEMKFAGAKAESKAHLKTIRELAGLSTGFKAEELKSGTLIFSKIRRSSKVLKMETAARLQALSRGNAGMALLAPVEPEPSTTMIPASMEVIPDAQPTPEPATPAPQGIPAILKIYQSKGLIPADKAESSNKIIAWFDAPGNSSPKDNKNYPSVKAAFEAIQSSIPADKVINCDD